MELLISEKGFELLKQWAIFHEKAREELLLWGKQIEEREAHTMLPDQDQSLKNQ